MMVHAVFAASVAVATLKVTAAAAWPLFATVVVKVEVPQPVLVGAAVPVSAQVGRVITILSLTASAPLSLKAVATVVVLERTGLAMVIERAENAGTAVAVEVVNAVAGASMASAMVAAIVRVF